MVNASLTLNNTGGSITSDGTEQTIYEIATPLGVHKPLCMSIDLDNMTVTETIYLRLYIKDASGGSYKLFDAETFVGADGGLPDNEKVTYVHFNPNRFGWKITLQLVGTNRAFVWDLFKET